ncbi:hypothetical protein [Streptomyces sp. NPDC002845]
MRRGLVHVLAWLLATSAAATLSWWGVHTVMAGTAYDPPRALPITTGDPALRGAQALATSTVRPEPSGNTTSPGGRDESRESSPTSTASTPAGRSPTPTPTPPPTASGQVKSYDTDGGRVVFSLGEASATLVSATPGSGWSMQVWKTETWIRVEFSSGADRVTVFCTWHDSAPRVDIGTY